MIFQKWILLFHKLQISCIKHHGDALRPPFAKAWLLFTYVLTADQILNYSTIYQLFTRLSSRKDAWVLCGSVVNRWTRDLEAPDSILINPFPNNKF